VKLSQKEKKKGHVGQQLQDRQVNKSPKEKRRPITGRLEELSTIFFFLNLSLNNKYDISYTNSIVFEFIISA
jgi:hypothetical protein